jgi:hypothetical protein
MPMSALHDGRLTLQEDSWYSFMLEAESTPGLDCGWEGLGKLKKKSQLIGNRTRDLPACSIVPQPATPPRAPSTHSDIDNFSPVRFP